MSEQVAETTTEAATADESLGDAGKKAIAAERAARKAAEDQIKTLQAQLDAFNQSQMSDLEKAQAQAQDAETAAATATTEALRWRIAATHGISADDAETFLTGSDEASLTRQAERLKTLAATASTTPKPDLSQGGSGASPIALNSDGLEQALREKLGIS